MFCKNCRKKFLFIYLLFLLYFFSNNLIYAISYTETENDFLIPIGNVIHIEAELENVIVRNSIKYSPFVLGDEIVNIK